MFDCAEAAASATGTCAHVSDVGADKTPQAGRLKRLPCVQGSALRPASDQKSDFVHHRGGRAGAGGGGGGVRVKDFSITYEALVHSQSYLLCCRGFQNIRLLIVPIDGKFSWGGFQVKT